jgi:hypothetical protein
MALEIQIKISNQCPEKRKSKQQKQNALEDKP